MDEWWSDVFVFSWSMTIKIWQSTNNMEHTWVRVRDRKSHGCRLIWVALNFHTTPVQISFTFIHKAVRESFFIPMIMLHGPIILLHIRTILHFFFFYICLFYIFYLHLIFFKSFVWILFYLHFFISLFCLHLFKK